MNKDAVKKVVILGSTGSIGTQTLEVIDQLGPGFEVLALGARGSCPKLLIEQLQETKAQYASVLEERAAQEIKTNCPGVTLLRGEEGLCEIAALEEADIVVSALVGLSGLAPTISAIKAKKRVALANKEVLVSAGSLIQNLMKKYKAELIPVDSEHSALFQCLRGEQTQEVSRLILTASGGPFWQRNQKELSQVKLDEALKHPNWSMGKKVTVDSSTLMNKGLEVIEARWLFDLPAKQIEVVIHPQSIVHSMVEFTDRSIITQMGMPSMLLPIQFALTYPKRTKGIAPRLEFNQALKLDFSPWDVEKFPCLRLAFEALNDQSSAPCFLNAANEVMVERFINGEISWIEISKKLEIMMRKHQACHIETLDEILTVDLEARTLAKNY